MKTLFILFGMALLASLSFGQKASVAATDKPDTPHLDFVKEFVRELAAVEDIRSSAEAELKEDQTKSDQLAIFSNMVHTATLYKLELGSEIEMLNGMHLNGHFDFLIPTLTGFYRAKIDAWDQMGQISSALLQAPKSGVDYGSLVAKMPELRARLDYVDQSIFQVSPAIFLTLVDTREDSKGHASHLIITKEERADLIRSIDTEFGSKLAQKNKNYTVGAAETLKVYLLKDWKSSDEPWD